MRGIVAAILFAALAFAQTGDNLAGRVNKLLAQQKNAEAISVLRQAVDRNPNDADALILLGVLIENHVGSDTAELRNQVEPLYRRALEIRERESGPNQAALADALELSARLFERTGGPEGIPPLKARALAIRQRIVAEMQPAVSLSQPALMVGTGSRGRHWTPK